MGIPIRILQKLMGHSTVVVTERYSHVANDDVAAAVNRLNGFLPNLLPSTPHGVDGGEASKSNGIMVPKGGANPHGTKYRGILSLTPAISVLFEILLINWNQNGIRKVDVSFYFDLFIRNSSLLVMKL